MLKLLSKVRGDVARLHYGFGIEENTVNIVGSDSTIACVASVVFR